MKSFKRQFIEKYISINTIDAHVELLEQELLEAIEKDESSVWPGDGVQMIAKERQRQIEIEKWDYNHDADYKHGELIGAAACYAMEAANKDLTKPIFRAQIHQDAELDFMVNSGDRGDRPLRPAGWKDAWPWDQKWDKRWKHDKLRCLQIAGALIAAEIDRLNPSTLQSRTAVKAESPSMSAGEMLQEHLDSGGFYGHTAVVMLMQRYANQFKQSQPTAGGVKEEKYFETDPILAKYAKLMTENEQLKSEIAKLKSQPSPSNPSIKRPTESEIADEITERYPMDDKYDKQVNTIQKFERYAFKAAINWLLSIQPDK